MYGTILAYSLTTAENENENVSRVNIQHENKIYYLKISICYHHLRLLIVQQIKPKSYVPGVSRISSLLLGNRDNRITANVTFHKRLLPPLLFLYRSTSQVKCHIVEIYRNAMYTLISKHSIVPKIELHCFWH